MNTTRDRVFQGHAKVFVGVELSGFFDECLCKVVIDSPKAFKIRKESKYLDWDKESGKIDFHSLRHTFGTLLAASGVHPKMAQDLMRHSDINLTMSRYTHTLTGQGLQAVESLPDLGNYSPKEQKATGTDHRSPDQDENHLAIYLDKICAQQRKSAEFRAFQRRDAKAAIQCKKPTFQGRKAGLSQ